MVSFAFNLDKSLSDKVIGQADAVKLISDSMKRSVSRLQLAGLRSPEGMAEYRKLLEYGVVNSNVRMGDLKNLMRDTILLENIFQMMSFIIYL